MRQISGKHILLSILHKFGFYRIVRSGQRNKITILMLHGVTDPTSSKEWKPLRPRLDSQQLLQNLTIISQHYSFISLSEAVEMLAGTRPLQPNSVAMTFDDGYRNNLSIALPILRQFNAVPTIFLPTKNINEQKPLWFDRLDYAIQTAAGIESANKILKFTEIDFSNRKTLTASFISFIRKEKQKYNTNEALRAVMNNLSERLEQISGRGLADIFDRDPYSKLLTWNEVRNTSHEVCFGSHGVSHPILNLLSPTTIKRELTDSRRTIEFYTGEPCLHLAYPYGSFNDEVVRQVKACNFLSAVTTIPGLNTRKNNLLTLRRIAFPRTDSIPKIIATVAGCSAAWQKAKELPLSRRVKSYYNDVKLAR